MYIGDIKIDNPVVLAPMAGVSDYPFRQIAREMGCQLLYTEMVSSKGLIYNNKRTEDLLHFNQGNSGFIAVQLFGNDIKDMGMAAEIIEREFEPDIIDINMGCPTPKITKNGAGAALMKEPVLAEEVVAAVVNAVDLPVTVKIRKGWKKGKINAVEIAQRAESKGARAVAIHGRTREQYYSGQADWEIIKTVQENLEIPVIGNGDIFNPGDAEEMIKITGCQAVMIGRGAQGNPWLLKRTWEYLKTGKLLPEPDYCDRIQMAIEHLERSADYYGPEIGIPKMRKHISWYLKGLPYAARVKDSVNQLNDLDRIRELLLDYREKLSNRLE